MKNSKFIQLKIVIIKHGAAELHLFLWRHWLHHRSDVWCGWQLGQRPFLATKLQRFLPQCGAHRRHHWVEQFVELRHNYHLHLSSKSLLSGEILWNNSSSFGKNIAYTCPVDHFFQVTSCSHDSSFKNCKCCIFIFFFKVK